MAASVAFVGVTSPFERPVLKRARALCLRWPEVTEKTAWGHPCFKAGKKMFCAFEMIKGRPSIAFKLPARRAARRVKKADYFVTPYGRNEWVSVWVDADVDWDVVEDFIEQSYRATATKGMLKLIAATMAAVAVAIPESWHMKFKATRSAASMARADPSMKFT
mgnify:CR=1 FL=1